MFGYIRPLKAELKVREYELYKAAYCGVCTELKKRSGSLARNIVNYDLAFLAMLITKPGSQPAVCSARCPASPLKRKKHLCQEGPFALSADYTVILTYWKLKDSMADGALKERLISSLGLILLKRKYLKAARLHPEISAKTERLLTELSELEGQNTASIDIPADKFALLLSACAESIEDDTQRRITEQLLYHLGRFIYIIDALDDYSEDAKKGSYNPLAARFETNGRPLTEEEKEEIKLTLSHSIGLIASAYELKDKNLYDGILSNIIYLGLENALKLVLDGKGKTLIRRKE